MTLTERLTSEEENAVKELQTRMKGFLTPKLREDPTLFYRFLKARDFNVDNAEKMLMKHIIWRKVYQVDTILEDLKPKKYFYKYVLPSPIGVDKDGDLVVYGASGRIETADILKCDKINECKKSCIWLGEKNLVWMKEQSQKTGKECNQMTFIINFDKLTFSNVAHKTSTEIWLGFVHIFQDNHPERMKAVYMINAPGYYVLVYSVVKTVMSNSTLQKIHVFGQNGWKEKLLNIVDADVLPVFLGGNRMDPDGNPLCLSFINHGGKIPLQYYLSNEDRYFKDTSKVKTMTVPYRRAKEIYLEIKEEGSTIKWEYLVKNKDIGFGLSFQESEQSTKEEIIPIQRYSTVDGTETGFFKSQFIGKYIIIFDNSHSWISSKEIEYCLMVIKPE